MDNLDIPLRDILPIMQDKITKHSTYFGIPTLKCPTDAWVYQEIITEIKPDVIIEIGTYYGGSALMLAHLCDNAGKGLVYSIDKNPLPKKLFHPRIQWLTGDAVTVLPEIHFLGGERVLVIEDSSHEYDNTLAVLRAYSPLVTIGSYFIVEDTICNHGLPMNPVPGPYEAVETFLEENKHFEVDRTREPYVVTWNPKGYLKRVS